MRRILMICAAVVPFLFSGCYVQSLHPFYTDETRIEIPVAEGHWQPLEDDGSDADGPPWVIENDKILTYSDDVPSEIKVRYFVVNGQTFADWTAGDLGDDAPPNLYWRTHVVPTHSVFKVDPGEGYLGLTPLDVEWLDDEVEAGNVTLPHVKVDDDRRVFTATPEEWTRFLMEYGNSAKAFDPDDDGYFLWVPPPAEVDAEQEEEE